MLTYMDTLLDHCILECYILLLTLFIRYIVQCNRLSVVTTAYCVENCCILFYCYCFVVFSLEFINIYAVYVAFLFLKNVWKIAKTRKRGSCECI